MPIIHVLNRTSDPGWVGFDGWGAAFGFDDAHLTHGIRYSKVSSGLQAAVSGQGLVLWCLAEAFRAIEANRLVMPFGGCLTCPTQYAYRLVWVRDAVLSDLQKDFAEWLLGKSRKYQFATRSLLGVDVES